MSLSLSLRHRAEAQDTSEHISARSCPCFSLFNTARTHRTRASTLVLARVLYVLIPVPSTPWGHRGHERALMCSLVSSSLSLQARADAQDTSEHIGARPCPVCPYPCPFDAMGTPRTRASTNVLTRVLISLFKTARTHRTRASTSVLARVLYVPICPFDAMGTPRTQASTLVLARVLISLSSTPWGHPGHERAHRCSLVSCVSLSLYLWIPRTQVSTLVLTGVLYVPIPVSFKQLHVYCYRPIRHLYLSDCQSNKYILCQFQNMCEL